jgi:hypothetical protein
MEKLPTYSRHARDQMVNRSITEQEVEETLRTAHTQYTDKKGNSVLIAHVGTRRIKVVVAKDSDPPHIINTAD